jgi:hypothetical protein
MDQYEASMCVWDHDDVNMMPLKISLPPQNFKGAKPLGRQHMFIEGTMKDISIGCGIQ